MRYVLFVCTHNAGRSQMAQAFFEKYAPDDLRAESGGSAPAEGVWPEVVEAMREVGIDISGRTPRKLDLEMQLHADWALTMHCEDTCPYVPGVVEDWDIPDPAGQPLEDRARDSRRHRGARQAPDRGARRRHPVRPHGARAQARADPPATRRRVRGHEDVCGDPRVCRRGAHEIRRCPRAVVRRTARASKHTGLPARADV